MTVSKNTEVGNIGIRLLIILFLMGVFASIFLANPEIDLWFSSKFYDAGRGGFHIKQSFLATLNRKGIPIFIYAFGFAALVVFLINKFTVKTYLGVTGHRALFLIVAMIMGPGLVVNGVFKSHWDRARPSQIVQFGGTKQFSPPFIISDQCEKNCAFVSGHSSVGFYFVSLALLFSGARRRALYIGSIVFGCAVGFGRIVDGAHFLSDVIFSGFFTILVSEICYHLMIRRVAHSPDK